MERTWCDDPAFPGMNRTGKPIAFSLIVNGLPEFTLPILDLTWLGSHPTSRYSKSEYRLASGVQEVLNSDCRR